MSDNYLKLIPTQPEYSPAGAAQIAARKLLRSVVRESGEVTTKTGAEIEFVDAGGNFERITCPNCGEGISNIWWSSSVSQARQSRFRFLNVVTPCCQTEASLNDLEYTWPQGFARFVLVAKNPGITTVDNETLERLEELLGCRLRVIWARY